MKAGSGQFEGFSPSKALPLNIAIPDANSRNRFLPSRAVNKADFLQAGERDSDDRVDSRAFLQSLNAVAWPRRDSEDSVSTEQENSFIRMLNQADAGINAVQTPEKINTNTFVGAQDMSQTMCEVMSKRLSEDRRFGFLDLFEDITRVGGNMDIWSGCRRSSKVTR